jgi:hypothetical protein
MKSIFLMKKMKIFIKTLIPCFWFSCFNSSKVLEGLEGLKSFEPSSFGFDTF